MLKLSESHNDSEYAELKFLILIRVCIGRQPWKTGLLKRLILWLLYRSRECAAEGRGKGEGENCTQSEIARAESEQTGKRGMQFRSVCRGFSPRIISRSRQGKRLGRAKFLDDPQSQITLDFQKRNKTNKQNRKTERCAGESKKRESKSLTKRLEDPTLMQVVSSLWETSSEIRHQDLIIYFSDVFLVCFMLFVSIITQSRLLTFSLKLYR